MPKQKIRFTLALPVCLLALPFLLASAPASKVQSTVADGSSGSGLAPMPLYAPFFIEDREHSSTLTMVNQLAATVHATVIARTADGSIIGQRVVTFAPGSQQVVELRDILQSSDVSEAVGSVQVVPNPMEVWTMAILAQLSIVGSKQFPPVYLEEELLSPDPMQATVYRAVVPSATGSPRVALLNTAANEQTLSTTCLKADGERIRRDYALAASGLAVVSACRGDLQPGTQTRDLTLDTDEPATDEGSAVAVEVSSAAGMGTFAAWGMAPTRSADSRVSLSLNFANSSQARSAVSIFAGVPVGTTDLLGGEHFVPDLAVANFDTKATRITVLLSAMSGDDPHVQTVADVTVEPGAVRTIELHNVSGDSAMQNSFIVASDGQPGTVTSNLILRGERLYPAVQLIGKDGLDVNNAGDHPWSLANGDESTLLLFNHAAKTTIFNVDIAAAGAIWRQTYRLASNETRSIDLRQLVVDQVPDLDGKKLPGDATFGSASWFSNDSGAGTGRMLVSNPLTGLGRNFSCGGYLVLYGVGASTLSATFNVGATGTLGPLKGAMCISTNNPNACSGQQSGNNGSGFTYSWTSSNTSVAKVSGSSSNASATFSGVSTGTAQSNGQITLKGCSFTGQGTLTICGTPNSESTAFSQWGDNDPLANDDAAAAGFIQTLTPNTPAYAGGTVSESNASPSTDSCYFNGSAYPPIGGVAGSSWSVGSDSRWGPDYVGWVYAEFSYYQTIRPQMELSLPCSGTLFQKLTFKCPQGASYVYDSLVVLQSTISGTGITDSREGQTAARQLIGH